MIFKCLSCVGLERFQFGINIVLKSIFGSKSHSWKVAIWYRRFQNVDSFVEIQSWSASIPKVFLSRFWLVDILNWHVNIWLDIFKFGNNSLNILMFQPIDLISISISISIWIATYIKLSKPPSLLFMTSFFRHNPSSLIFHTKRFLMGGMKKILLYANAKGSMNPHPFTNDKSKKCIR